jgi:predicted transcriptional regulator
MADDAGAENLLELTAEVVSAYVSNNSVQLAALADLIGSVHISLARLALGAQPTEAAAPVPAVPIKKSVTPDYIICLDDGKKFKSLKRHLNNSYGMTPQEYRQKWGLPSSYPMVAPNYAAIRSALAKTMGLGRKPGEGPKGKGSTAAKNAKAGGKSAKAK